MNDVHVKYVEDVVDLSERAGERATLRAFSFIERIGEKTSGNPTAFVAALHELKDLIVPTMLKVVRGDVIDARQIGKQFLNDKMKGKLNGTNEAKR